MSPKQPLQPPPPAPTHKKRMRSLNGLLFDNPVLMNGLALVLVAAGCVNLKAAFAFSLLTTVTLIPAVIVIFLLRHDLSEVVKTPIAVGVATVFYLLGLQLLPLMGIQLSERANMVLPLVVVNSLLIYRANNVRSARFRFVLVKMLTDLGGFAIAAVIVGGIRELLATGTLWDIPLFQSSMSIMSKPAMGIILLGLLAALARGLSSAISVSGRRDD